jgi:hypothetical protein
MTLFQSTTGRQNILVSVDLNQSNLEDKLWNWLEQKHNEIFWDIEMHEGGSIRIEADSVEFSGDNGIFTLEAIETETI